MPGPYGRNEAGENSPGVCRREGPTTPVVIEVAAPLAIPDREGVAQARKARRKLGTVPCQHAEHGVVLDPLHALRRVNLVREVGREEAVTVETARRHQDEDAERR